MTHCVDLFQEIARARTNGITMTPRSANDKEYFAQDWFNDRASALGITVEQQGRNSYPDFLLGTPPNREGYEVKSLAFTNGRPARKDIDFNSTIPSGRKDDVEIFLVFFLYEGTGANRREVHTVVIAHCDLINSDHALADAHVNPAIHNFGSYADGFIRNRKMYVFPHPVTIDEASLGEARLVVPTAWGLEDDRIAKVKTLSRKVAGEAILEYTVNLRGNEPQVTKVPASGANSTNRFDVFRLAGDR